MGSVASVDVVQIVHGRQEAERISGLHFSVWVGDSDEEPRPQAERLHAALADPEHAVYLACNTRLQSLEVVTGSAARQTLTDEECEHTTDRMRKIAATGDLTSALVLGLQHLGTYALD